MAKFLYLMAGGMAGTLARFCFSSFVYGKWGMDFPYGTMAVNVSGCFLAGLFSVLAHDKFWGGPEGKILLITGFCGAYTTFSAFMVETSNLLDEAQILKAALNIFISIILGLVFLRLGMWLGENIG